MKDKDKILTVNEYLDVIRPHLRDIINDHKTQSEWKIQLTMIKSITRSFIIFQDLLNTM